ncbi:hypothetical protein GCM10023311_23240 [Flaviramulus aquimarinus]|uniref:EF-hand domain-containing protein n=1 Tax=Flaviramulus aquimarinus TaxID=1170456 RepID=A0ABP9FBR4_9FLAO
MKDTLEYKILKHLKDNDNGEYIDLSEFISDLKLLRIKLSSLSKKPEKYISFNSGTDIRFGDGDNFKRECTLAKIEFSGIKYMNEIENGNKVITNNGVLIQDSVLRKSPIKNKVNAEPNNKPEQKSFVKKIFSSGWTLAFVMLIIEEITLGKIWKFISDLF